MGRTSAVKRSGRISAVYAAVAGAWIWLSDGALALVVTDAAALSRYSVVKGLFFVVTTTAMLFLLMRRSFDVLEQSYDALATKSQALRDSQRTLATVVGSTRDGIVTVDDEGRIVMINPAAREMLGRGEGDVVGEELDGLLASPLPADESTLRLSLRGERRGGERPVEASTSRVTLGEGELRTVILRDITQRRAYEAEIQRLNRLHAALSAINQGIARAWNREELFERTCDALVEHGRFAAAWITWRTERDELQVVASRGDETGVLSDPSAWTAEERGALPSRIALEDGLAFVSNDMINDETIKALRSTAEERGWRACGSFPVRMDGEIVGLLNVVADTRGVFQDKEIELLGEAAIDLSFALDRFTAETKRRRAEALARSEREFSDAMIESMPGILYFYDDEGRFLRWNENFEAVSGYAPDEIAAMGPLDFLAPEDQSSVEERIAAVFEHGESAVEAPFLTKDGRRIPYFFTGRRVQHAGKACLVGVGIDISERVAAEQALRTLADTLERRVAERTEELRAALVRAEEADRLKSAFLATMSHELRTPLNSIIGFTGILLQRLAGPLNEEQDKQLGMVRSSARHLLALINDVLDLSKIEAGQLTVADEPFALPAAIEQAVQMVRPMAEAQGLAVEIDIASEIGEMVGDRRRVEQVLLNLLNNAVKFTDEGRVSLAAHLEDRDGGPVVSIAVTDTGIGIEEKDLAHLFKAFRQLDAGLTRQHEGTGLGLAICQRLVDLMGGTMGASSERGVGSTFTVVLPLAGRRD